MAPPPKLRSLRPEDYDFNDPATDWGPRLLQALTQYVGDVTSGLTRNLTRTENIRSEEREILFATLDPVAIDTKPFPLRIRPQVAMQPRHVTITNPCVDNVAPVGAAQPFWRMDSDGNVVIRLISGLDANTTYKMRLLLE